ncbi:hypothetical protein HHL11_12810 [Ramlibacter sp. G-1-2-2]|uniref:Uncharacterized protein n=1 Tax=Ramlibacter agri TaxID=2728837 RepID=A0A848H546_9BURK|nr:hypothetical protein [Ramlibacter agri]NML44639.1 hypothetical protein [Ramlibacter agri]
MDATIPLQQQSASRAPAGMLAIWHDVAPGQAAAVRDWYAREHHFERLAVPGFLDARRYERVAGNGAEFFGSYRLAAPAVLRSAAYQARVDAPTPWTREAMRQFRNMCRTACTIAAEAGRARGGHLATLAASDASELEDAAGLCERLRALAGVLRVTAIAAEAGEATPPSTELALRGRPDAQVRWALLLDADSQQAAEDALLAAQDATACRRPAQFAVYRLCFSARHPQ